MNALQRMDDFRVSTDRPIKDAPDSPEALIASLAARLEKEDLEGAIAEFQWWADRDDIGQARLVAFTTLLIESLAATSAQAKTTQTAVPLDRAIQVEPERSMAVSTHFTALTAAVVRQRSQINELTMLVERLSHRLS